MAPRSLRADADTILRAAIAAADPAAAVERALGEHALLDQARAVHVFAIGKAAAAMTAAALRHVHAASADVVVPHGTPTHHLEPFPFVRIVHAGHPLPDLSSLAAGNAIDERLAGIPAGDLVLFLISGGASALAVLPEDDITFVEYAHCIDLLMRAGADIRELNTVRHHIDSLKGGGMARRTAHTRATGLILSDVVGDALDVIASGPLTPPTDSPADAVRILRSRGVWDQCAPSIRASLTRAPTRDDVPTTHVRTSIVAGNRTAVDGAAAAARRLGYHVHVVDQPVTGEARTAGERLGHFALDARTAADGPTCFIAGGETTVTVRGNGRGGRNQELALAAALVIASDDHIAIGSIGTDGVDGPTDAAGAIGDAGTIRTLGAGSARAALDDNDSYRALDTAGALIRTGPTGTNVADVQVVLLR